MNEHVLLFAGQCLNSVSEDNAEVISTLRGYERELLGLLSVTAADNKLLLLKTLVAGECVYRSPL